MLPKSFPRSTDISKEYFDKLPREVSFSFHRRDAVAGFWADMRAECVLLKVSDLSKLEESGFPLQGTENRYICIKKSNQWIYPASHGPAVRVPGGGTQEESSYTIDGLEPLVTDIRGKYESPGIEDVAALIKKYSGEEIVIYTGAGISKAGNVPVWTFSELKNELGIGENNGAFTEKFFTDPGTLIDAVKTFRDQLFADSSTLAHEAIAELISLKPGIMIFTENYDLKHEAAGSRVSACHTHTDGKAFDMVKLRAPVTKLLLTVGLSYDDVAAIAYMKKRSPNMKLVCICLSSKDIPAYIGETDAVLTGDCQELLPQLVSLVKTIVPKK